jgi:hypothetical protein
MCEPDPEPRYEATQKDRIVSSAEPTTSGTRPETEEVNP